MSGDTTRRPIGVLGGGRWGFALANAARNAGNEVILCTRRDAEVPLPNVTLTADLKVLGQRTRLILLAVPSTVARTVASTLGDVTDGSHMVVHGVRGLSDEGLLPLSEIVRQETPVRKVGALGGPVVVEDLINDRPTVIATASRFPEVLDAMQDALGSPLLRVSESTDLAGLEWASALVGALMVGLGYARASGVTGGLLAGVMIRALQEAASIGVAAGAEERTFYGLAGTGDLMAAMSVAHRPEVAFGEALANRQGDHPVRTMTEGGTRIEAVDLVPRVCDFAREHGLQVPVFYALREVIAGRADKATVLPALMSPQRERRARRG